MLRTVADLRDKAGLRVRKKRTPTADQSNEPMIPSLPSLAPHQAFEQRRRSLEFWQEASGSCMTISTVERSTCGGVLRAVNGEQSQLIIDNLETPMGTYASATVRTRDLLWLALTGSWRLSSPLPLRPAWVDDDQTCSVAQPPLAQTPSAAAEDLPSGGNAATVAAGSTVVNEKYFVQRYMLFSRYDEGVQLDDEGWYSVTPEVLARHIATRCRCDLIIDAFAGVGGNAIQFAFECERVYAIEIDRPRLLLAEHNARVYGVNDRIEWLHGDFMSLAPSLHADVVFLSPPWGGPGYADSATFDLVTMMGGLDGAEILRSALRVAPNVAYFLPRNADERQIEQLAREAGVPVEVECCRLNGHVKGLMAYFGFVEEGAGEVDDG